MSLITPLALDRFVALFSGYTGAYGQNRLSGHVDPRGKVEGKSYTVTKELRRERYHSHLSGEGPSLGVIMLREDFTCVFGAIDVDSIGIDLAELERQIRELNLPLVTCRSKSGGAHLYVFLSTPVAGTELRTALSSWAASLSLASSEIFPKQTVRANSQDVGNFINLPYYDAADTARFGIRNGARLSLSEFLDYAEESAVAPDALMTSEITHGTLLSGGPPCLQLIKRNGGLKEGSKRNGMFSVGVYLTKRFPDEWETKLDEYNREMCEGIPLRSDEVQGIKKSLLKKGYNYRCNDQPLCSVCDRPTCLKREFGVKAGSVDTEPSLVITSVTRYVAGDTSFWSLEIDGKAIVVDTATFADKNKFNLTIANQIGILPIHISSAKWQRNVDELMRNANVVEESADVSETGQLWEWITAYIDGAKCTSKNQIVVSGAFADSQTVYFRLMDLLQFLNVRRIPAKGKDVWSLLKEHGGSREVTTLLGRSYNIWAVPRVVRSDEGVLAPPEFEQATPF